MTPEERARKIAEWIKTHKECPHDPADGKCIECLCTGIAAQIAEAEQEVYDQANRDFDWLQSSVGKIYCSLTNNKLSKWNTDPDLLLAEVEDIQNEFWSKEIEEARSNGFAAAQAKAVEIALNAEIDGYDDEASEPLKQMFPAMQKQIAARLSEMKP